MRQLQFRLKFVIDNFKKISYNFHRRRHRKLENAGDQFKEQPQMFSTATVQPHQTATPFEIGMQDASNGEPFAPEMYFLSRPQQRRYAEGFRAVRSSVAVESFLGNKNFVSAEV